MFSSSWAFHTLFLYIYYICLISCSIFSIAIIFLLANYIWYHSLFQVLFRSLLMRSSVLFRDILIDLFWYISRPVMIAFIRDGSLKQLPNFLMLKKSPRLKIWRKVRERNHLHWNTISLLKSSKIHLFVVCHRYYKRF